MEFGLSIIGSVLGFFQDCMKGFDQANLAIKEGRALDQLRERLVGSHGVKAVIVEPRVSRGHNHDRPDLNVQVVVFGSTTPENRYNIVRMLIRINQRYGTNIEARIDDRKGI